MDQSLKLKVKKCPENYSEELIELMLDSIKEIRGDLASIKESAAASAAASAKIQEILKAFPSGDIDAHRRHHENINVMVAERKKFWREVYLHVAKTSTWAALIGIGLAVWHYLKDQLGK